MSFIRLVSGLAVAVLLALAPSAAHAQGEPNPPRTFGIDGAVVLPLGDYGEVATLGFGVLGRAEFPLSQKLSITGRAGAIYHLLDSDIDGSLWFVPIYGGAKYALGAGHDGFYVAAELGITLGFASVDTGFGTASDSDSELGATLGAGMRRGPLDLRAQLFLPDLSEADDPGLMATVGYDITSF